ncbi:MAG TPA: S28 family serine protease [Kofleriaceae bacterium]|nr:S28 family serine protease [Kofleriaceae bacterium]
MKRLVLALAVVSVSAFAACGSDDAPDPPKDLLGKLQAIPGVTVTKTPTDSAGFEYYVLHFTQPVDHADPDGQTFQQEVSLLHRDIEAPMVVTTTGYFDYINDRPIELTGLLTSNQVSIEHRYFGDSRPDPADWTKLTIDQMAADEHAIIAALRDIYPGAFVTTGASKGGMTATYHRRFYPDDVDATVPYVAPMSFGAPDTRYTAFVDAIGTTACRDALRAAATEMLKNRRAAMEQRASAQTGHTYSRIPIGPAVEGSIASLEWAFWQYYGINFCDQVPAATATDDALFDFLDTIAPIGDNDDAQVAAFEAYYYQAYAQLGYPDGNATYLDAFLMYTDADYEAALPTPDPPAYDGGVAMHDVEGYIQNEGTRLLFIYGEWDPWTGGQYELGNATDSLKLIQAQGSHGSRINRLAPADRDAAYGKLAAWTGVTPTPPAAKPVPDVAARRLELLDEPRVPPAMIRVLSRR